jgi:16S rRNA C1402 (ribose-2'-O) methylase RsmI
MPKLLDELKNLNFKWKIFIAREISKVFEQFFTWNLTDCEEFIKSWKIVIKWEFVIWLSNN